MTVALRPMRSANCVTSNAPTNDPAGIDATMAPWAPLLGCKKASASENDEIEQQLLTL